MKEDFINFMGYRPRQFFDISERFWNPELFDRDDGFWRLKAPVYSDLMKAD
jgi:hypothetical protein